MILFCFFEDYGRETPTDAKSICLQNYVLFSNNQNVAPKSCCIAHEKAQCGRFYPHFIFAYRLVKNVKIIPTRFGKLISFLYLCIEGEGMRLLPLLIYADCGCRKIKNAVQNIIFRGWRIMFYVPKPYPSQCQTSFCTSRRERFQKTQNFVACEKRCVMSK